MVRLLFITDFTESFAYALLRGIIRYSNETGQWVVCRMPPAYKRSLGLAGVIKWAKKWGADVVSVSKSTITTNVRAANNI